MNRSQRRKIEARTRHLPEMKHAAGVPADTPVHKVASTAWGQDDANWFKTHPGRAHRVREAFPGEVYARPLTDREVVEVVIVRQIEPGWRMRVPYVIVQLGPDLFEAMANLIDRAFHSESAAHCLFDMAMTAPRLVPSHEILAMIAAYENAPRHSGGLN